MELVKIFVPLILLDGMSTAFQKTRKTVTDLGSSQAVGLSTAIQGTSEDDGRF